MAMQAPKKALSYIVRYLRRKGFSVRSTKNHRNGTPSSYYVRVHGGEIRLSDHLIPFNEHRHQMARRHGRKFRSYQGSEVIVRVALDTAQARQVAEMVSKGFLIDANNFLQAEENIQRGRSDAKK